MILPFSTPNGVFRNLREGLGIFRLNYAQDKYKFNNFVTPSNFLNKLRFMIHSKSQMFVYLSP